MLIGLNFYEKQLFKKEKMKLTKQNCFFILEISAAVYLIISSCIRIEMDLHILASTVWNIVYFILICSPQSILYY